MATRDDAHVEMATSNDVRPELVNFPAHADSNAGGHGWSRREILVTSLTSGFALAVQPVSAQAVSTDARGLTAGEVKIPVKDGEIPAYRAAPDKGGPFPTVLVIQEIFGVHEHIRDVCRRLAKQGYLAIATELYARQGDVSKIADRKDLMPIVSRVPDAQVLSDLDASVDWAKTSGKGDVSRLGITGFCWGGRIVWLYAAHSDRLQAGVAWYGRIDGQRTELQPKFPIDVAGDLKAPVLGLYGGRDNGIPLSDVEKMRAALAQAKVETEIVVYPQAEHGFHADYRPSYSPQDAKAGWQRLLEWFQQHGVR